jgi:O-acetyl-ADP-ribose deacetylase (regulator of RNase III)
MFQIVQGDLIELAKAGQFHRIYHGCNCFHKMESGIAKQVAEAWPSAVHVDQKTAYASPLKLGTASSVVVGVRQSDVNPEGHLVVCNVYTQYKYGREGIYLDYEALEKFLFNEARETLATPKEPIRKVFGFPLIGCGLAGGDPDRVIPMLQNFADTIASKADVTLVLFTNNVR